MSFIKKRHSEFSSESCTKEIIDRILQAAHHAPSVGFMQPWNFIIVDSMEVKERLAWATEKERRALAIHYEEERATQF